MIVALESREESDTSLLRRKKEGADIKNMIRDYRENGDERRDVGKLVRAGRFDSIWEEVIGAEANDKEEVDRFVVLIRDICEEMNGGKGKGGAASSSSSVPVGSKAFKFQQGFEFTAADEASFRKSAEKYRKKNIKEAKLAEKEMEKIQNREQKNKQKFLGLYEDEGFGGGSTASGKSSAKASAKSSKRGGKSSSSSVGGTDVSSMGALMAAIRGNQAARANHLNPNGVLARAMMEAEKEEMGLGPMKKRKKKE